MGRAKLLMALIIFSLAYAAWAQEIGIMEKLKALVVEEEVTSPVAETNIAPEALMAMPSSPEELGEESAEADAPLVIFKTQEDIDRLLGENPRFVYDPRGLRDPMIIPWVRREIIIKETLKKVKKMKNEGNYGKALESLKDLLQRYPQSKYTVKITQEINEIEKELDKFERRTGERVVIVLPGWIRTHTSGIVWDEERPIVMIGDYALKVGDTVPRYEVTVNKIDPGEVTFEYKGELFPVQIKPLD